MAALGFVTVGYRLFTRDHADPLRPVDAIVVLGGEHDGREDYALTLARQGFARTVLVADPYRPYRQYEAELMARICAESDANLEVICFEPDPSTTLGEAIFTAQMAEQRGWSSVMVLSWRYHLVRARFIFRQRFPGELVMHTVPRSYDLTGIQWMETYTYQFAGIAKAAFLALRS